MAINFDTTINISDVAMFAGALIATVKILVSLRDTVRETSKAMIGLQKDVSDTATQVGIHHEWLIVMRADRALRERDRSGPLPRGRHTNFDDRTLEGEHGG
ncbi:MAG: hypothetical protein ABL982_00090 [Vicinamibacterales bacterium]